jgi:transcription antitermination factor NusG
LTITAGPFGGLQGIFETASGAQRVALLLDILGKSTRVVLNRSQVEATETPKLPPARQICGTG